MQPPQNPYNQPGYGQPESPYGGPIGQQPRGTVSLDVIGESWNLVKASLGQWLLAMVIIGVVTLVFVGISQVIQRPFIPSSAPGQTPRLTGGFWVSILITQVLGLCLGAVIATGVFRMAIEQTRTGVAAVSNLSNFGGVVLPMIGASILVGLSAYIGTLLCIVPGVILTIAFAMTQLLIVDKRLGAIEAMKTSWSVMMPNLGAGFVLGLVLFLVNLLGAIPCGLGLFITYPMTIVSGALVYRDLFGATGTGLPNSGYTPPPIANPNF